VELFIPELPTPPNGKSVTSGWTVQSLTTASPDGEWGFRSYTYACGDLNHSTKMDPDVRYPSYSRNRLWSEIAVSRDSHQRFRRCRRFAEPVTTPESISSDLFNRRAKEKTMNGHVSWVNELAVKDGKLEKFRELMEEMAFTIPSFRATSYESMKQRRGIVFTKRIQFIFAAISFGDRTGFNEGQSGLMDFRAKAAKEKWP
jgi:hypothetical protein